jgi:Zn-dependent protease with chaperone function
MEYFENINKNGGTVLLENKDLRNQLVHRKETIYFTLTLVFSILAYIGFLFSIIGILIILALMIVSYFFHALSMASIRRNGVRLSGRQFPDIYQKAVKLAEDMELEKMPSIYVMESMGILNAFATRFFGKNMVVVYSEIFDLSVDEREDELLFVLAHEFAHLKRRHVLVHFLLLPAMFIPFLGEAYLRACEYTCDRFAAYYVGNVEASKEALSMLAIGKKLSSKMNQEAFVEQIREESGFFVWLNEKLSSHPDLPKRINALDHWIQPNEKPLIPEKKSGIIIGIIISIFVFISLIGAVAAIAAGSSALASFMEDQYLYEEEVLTDYPPVIQATMDYDLDMLQQLVKDGANLEEKDSEGMTSLQYAVTWANLEAAQMLLENGAEVNTKDDWGSTPLMNAVHNESETEMVQLLLDNGADPTLKDSEGYTAYDYAVEYKNAELRDLLK